MPCPKPRRGGDETARINQFTQRCGSMTAGRLIALLCLVSLRFIDPPTIAQEVVGQYRSRAAMEPTVLTVGQEKVQAAKPGSDFKECANGCPTMIVVPAGKFTMGSPESEKNRNNDEGPQHEVDRPATRGRQDRCNLRRMGHLRGGGRLSESRGQWLGSR